MTKIDELRELVGAVGRLVDELAGVELTDGEVDEVQWLAVALSDYAELVDDVAVVARGVVTVVVWSDGVVYEWGAGDVLIDRRAGTIEDAEWAARLHDARLEMS